MGSSKSSISNIDIKLCSWVIWDVIIRSFGQNMVFNLTSIFLSSFWNRVLKQVLVYYCTVLEAKLYGIFLICYVLVCWMNLGNHEYSEAHNVRSFCWMFADLGNLCPIMFCLHFSPRRKFCKFPWNDLGCIYMWVIERRTIKGGRR